MSTFLGLLCTASIPYR